MPGQTEPALQWPYTEGLRMDEAMHPLAMMAVGLYGEVLPNQNGAPIRLVVPWKYGFKGIKSIVRMRFVESQPLNTWQQTAGERIRLLRQRQSRRRSPPVEPDQTERRLGELFRRKTLPFNGYADQVASLYAGMDLRRVLLIAGEHEPARTRERSVRGVRSFVARPLSGFARNDA